MLPGAGGAPKTKQKACYPAGSTNTDGQLRILSQEQPSTRSSEASITLLKSPHLFTACIEAHLWFCSSSTGIDLNSLRLVALFHNPLSEQ